MRTARVRAAACSSLALAATLYAPAAPAQAFRDACLRRRASGKLGTIHDMARIAVFLASRARDLITAQSIVTGGDQSIFAT